MKIYLASSFLNKYNARQAMSMIENAGHTITHDWTTHPTTDSTRGLKKESVEDLKGVENCDIFILLWPGRMGSNAELGAALAYGKPCILVGGINPLDSVYFNHPRCRRVGTITDAINILEEVILENGGTIS
jgi:nucleoside 2-deoxyribosyltransferase